QFLLANAHGIPNERHYYFYPVHHGFEPWYLVESGSSEGLNGTLEPAAVALRIMNEQIAGRKVGELTQPIFGVYALSFHGSKDDLVAMWTLDFPVTLTLSGRVLGAVDFMGNEIALNPFAKTHRITVNGYPIYLRLPKVEKIFAAPRVRSKARNEVECREKRHSATASWLTTNYALSIVSPRLSANVALSSSGVKAKASSHV
ncbi:MAG: hypothetical protein N2381_10965, partial [Armatimonadetes bacterium]|nr:hypothetical protein [Armatimonadota bacterium]